MNNPFKLKNAALLMALAAIYPVHALAATGIAQFAVGDVNVRRGATTMPLNRGALINSGDNIITGRAGQTQIRFSDGGLVSLAPNSQFNIDKYVDDNKPEEDGFFASLLRGGMRAITGLVGKRNRESYKITTTTATIGIRGSAFSANYNPDGSLNVAGEQDGIIVCTNAGCVELIVGEAVRVTGSDDLPARTADRSNVPPLVARQDLFEPESPLFVPDVPLQGQPTLTGVVAGVSAMFSFTGENIDLYPRGGEDPSDGQAHFVANELVRHVGSVHGSWANAATVGPLQQPLQTVEKTSTEAGQFELNGAGDDPALAGWGYWAAGRLTYEDSNQPNSNMLEAQSGPGGQFNQGVHYVVGRPTMQTQMPMTGTASYELLGHTKPTAYDGETLRFGTLTGAGLNVDFVAARVNAFVNTTFALNDGNIAVQIGGVGDVEGTTFTSSDAGNGYFYGSTQDRFAGFFIGTQAQRAGMVYQSSNASLGSINGAAMFEIVGDGQAFTEQAGMAAMFASSDDVLFDYYPRGGIDPSIGTGYFVGNQLYLHDGGSGTYLATSGVVSDFGSKGVPVDTDFVGWGHWDRSHVSSGISPGSVHYLVGRPTAQAQMQAMTGTASFALVGNSRPTAYDGETLRVGTLTGAGLNVDFGAGRVNAYFNTAFAFDGQSIPVQIGGYGYIEGTTFYADTDGNGYYYGDGDSYYGFFIGDQALRAGMLYRSWNESLGSIRGAAAFEKAGDGQAFTEQAGMSAMFASTDDYLFDYYPRGDFDPSYGTGYFVGNQLYLHDDGEDSYNGYGYGGGSTYLATTKAVSQSGSLGNVGDADYIGWGYWVKGTIQSPNSGSSVEGVHHIVGRPTPDTQMPIEGTATYSMVGGTLPTATHNGNTIMGRLLGATMNVDFSSSRASTTINTEFQHGGATVGVSIQDNNMWVNGAWLCGNNINGFFTGDQATRAGLIYRKDTDTDLGVVRGAVGLARGAIAPPAAD